MHSKIVIFLAIAAYAIVLTMPQGEGAYTTTEGNSTSNDTICIIVIRLQSRLHECITLTKALFEEDFLTEKGFLKFVCACLDRYPN